MGICVTEITEVLTKFCIGRIHLIQGRISKRLKVSLLFIAL